MNGRKAKEARRIMRALFPRPDMKPRRTNVKAREAVLLGGLDRFFFVTSTVLIPGRNRYRHMKRRILTGESRA